MPDRLDAAFSHHGGEDRWYANEHDFSSRLEASDDAGRFSVVLDLANQKVPYEAGGIGYLPFARSGWFSYYSLTRLAASGTLRFGAEFPVTSQRGDDQARQKDDAQRVGGDDVAHVVGRKIHQRSPISAIWIWRILRAAISARMAVRCSARNRKL